MSYCNQDILKSFAAANSWITDTPTPDGLDEAIAQADDIIFQKTGLLAPADPTTARAILRNIACAIVYWISTGQQSKIDEQDYNWRKTQYDNAIATLNQIESGELELKDDAGTALTSNKPTSVFCST